MSRQPQSSTDGNSRPSPPDNGAQAGYVYPGQRDQTAPVGEECTVTVDGETLDYRYDLLSASPAGFEWNYRGSGPAQLGVALLAHAFSDEFACKHYQQFKAEVVANLSEDRWTLRTSDLEAWHREVVDDA